MPKVVEIFSIACNTLTAGIGLAFVCLSSFTMQKHYVHEVLVSPVIVEAFAALSFGCVLLLTEIVINSVWCTLGHRDRQSNTYKYIFIVGAVWKTFILIAQLAVGLVLFTPTEVRSKINATMSAAFDAYDPAILETTERVDHFQQDAQCCGLYDYQYWFDKLNGNDVTPGCCKDVSDEACYKNINYADITTVQDKIYTIGCYEAYTYSLQDSSLTATILFYFAATLLVLAIISYIVNLRVNSGKWSSGDVDEAYAPDFMRNMPSNSEEGQGLMHRVPVPLSVTTIN